MPYFPLTKMVIRLGHFSVREYLVSEGIKDSKVSKFSIIDIVADLFIAESCLQYILYYDGLDSKTFSQKDLEIFPLLEYLCQFWYIHFAKILPENLKFIDSLL